MAEGAWSQSVCRGDTWWWGISGAGTWYWTARWGQHWMGGTPYQIYAANGFECGALGPPVKDYGFISEFGPQGGEGVWLLGGAIVFRYDTRRWHVYQGDFGQTAGRLTNAPLDVSSAVEIEGDWPTDLPKYTQPKAPKPPKVKKAE